MTPYVGCEYAREHLDGFVDDELSVDEQVAVESHLRWCRTCADRVEDLQLIGDIDSGRSVATLAPTKEVEPRQRPARARPDARPRGAEQAFWCAFREMFTDMRLLWPALGATTAVTVCLAWR